MKSLEVGCRVLLLLNKYQEAFWVNKIVWYAKKNFFGTEEGEVIEGEKSGVVEVKMLLWKPNLC